MFEFLSRNVGLVVVMLLFGSYGIVWRIKRNEMKRREGVDPDVIVKATGPVQKYFGFMVKAMSILLPIIMVLHVSFMPTLAVTAPLFGSSGWQTKFFGFVVGLLGLLLCRAAQVAIGKSWRVGIDEEAQPGLVTTGLYRRVRNPTYSGLFLLCIGAFIAMPTLLILYWMLAFYITIEIQVRCEEEYLDSTSGEAYRAYRMISKRYIPFLW